MREKYGPNVFPESPMEGFFALFIGSFEDPVLRILLAACVVSIVLGMVENPTEGYVEGVTLFIP